MRRSGRIIIVSLFPFAFCVLFAKQPKPAPSVAPKREVTPLEQRISSLELRVGDLERRLDEIGRPRLMPLSRR